MTETTTVVYDAAELVTPTGSGVRRYENAAVVAIDGVIEAVGPSGEITEEYPPENADRMVEATGKSVVPGLVDPHTHALFAGDRSDEFQAKLAGKSYQEILNEGGGILRTVRAVRDASDAELIESLLTHLDAMLASGTTTVEIKSGYGLDTETELRMLDIIKRADREHPIDIIPTFLGAHAVPDDRSTEEYVQSVIDDQLPAVAEQGIAEFCDVFCEEGVFSVEQSRRILETGKREGLVPKIHAEEFEHLGGAQLAADLGAASADHLLQATAADGAALEEAGVVPVLLPGTAFALNTEYADPGLFSNVALATDFNPNCYIRNMGFVLSLSCYAMRMPPETALAGATRRAAAAIGRDDGTGTLTEGAPADMLLLDAPSYVHLPYRVGTSPVATVIKKGSVVAP